MLQLDAESLYAELRQGVRSLLRPGAADADAAAAAIILDQFLRTLADDNHHAAA